MLPGRDALHGDVVLCRVRGVGSHDVAGRHGPGGRHGALLEIGARRAAEEAAGIEAAEGGRHVGAGVGSGGLGGGRGGAAADERVERGQVGAEDDSSHLDGRPHGVIDALDDGVEGRGYTDVGECLEEVNGLHEPDDRARQAKERESVNNDQTDYLGVVSGGMAIGYMKCMKATTKPRASRWPTNRC